MKNQIQEIYPLQGKRKPILENSFIHTTEIRLKQINAKVFIKSYKVTNIMHIMNKNLKHFILTY